MRFFTKQVQGSISLFLVLIMLPMFVLAGLIVDGARISAARTAVSGAGDLAMNAALSEYDKVLHDVYGLFAMSESMDELQTNVNLYFSNTINNTGLLQSSDSYTRSFFNSIGSMFSGDDISFDNIVDTEVESFSMVTVSNSALANPSVMRRQIVDYMKIRGPVNIGTTLLTKLGCIGETSKQNKAVKAKVKYDKKLKSVQEACETAYNAINAFNENVTNSRYNNSTYLSDLNSDLATSKENTRKMIRIIVATKMDQFKVEKIDKDNDYVNNTVKSTYDNTASSETDAAAQALARYQALESILNNSLYMTTTTSTNGVWTANGGICGSRIDGWTFNGGGDFDAQKDIILDMNRTKDIDTKIYSLGKASSYFGDAYSGISDTKKAEDNNKITGQYNAYVTMSNNAKTLRDTAYGWRGNDWHNEATAYGRDAARTLYNDWLSKVDTIVTNLEDSIEALETVKTKASELQDAKGEWRGRLDDLSDSDIKTTMEGDYTNCAQQINEAVVNELITILTNNKNHFTFIKEKLENIDFNGKKLIRSNFESYDYYGQLNGSVTTNADDTDVDGIAYQQMTAKYHGVDDINTGLSPATFTKITEENQFYKFLTNNCGSNATDETAKSAATSQRDELVGNANNAGTSASSPDVSSLYTGGYTDGTGLTDAIIAEIETLAAGGVVGNTFSATSIESGSDNDMADNASDNLSSISSLLDGLGSIAEAATKTLYLEEYFTEMFSCFTTDKGDHPSKFSLSGHDLSGNKFYRSEAEYILWGCDTVEGNIAATVALIFGIRFALNAIFAFTNSNTRTPALSAATAIAGWTGFGVPIVQSVILLAWALAESIVDVGLLCDGEDVVIYKTWDSWYTGPNGVKDLVQKAAEACIDNVFDKISQVANDSIDSVKGDIEKYADDTLNGVQESIVSSVSNSVQTLVISVVGESNYNMTEADVKTRVDQMIDGFENSINGSDAVASAMRAVVPILRNKSSWIATKLYGYYNNAKEGITTTVENLVNELITPIKDEISGVIHEKLDEAATALKGKVDEVIAAGGDKVKENLNGAIDDFLGDLGGSGGSVTAGNSSSTSTAVRLTLNYKEYLKIFILMNMIGNEEKMLNRCAKMIQINVSQENPSFNVAQAYTMAEINSSVTIRTTFFDIPVSTGVDASGNPTYDLDFSQLGSGRQRVNYVGILGY